MVANLFAAVQLSFYDGSGKMQQAMHVLLPVGVSEGNYFHSTFPNFILKQKLQINALEFLTVMVTV